MARYIGPVCKLCRREGQKLFLKGARCATSKCAMENRNYGPGEHGRGFRKRPSNYGMQLREKQKARRIYGLMENQFRLTFDKASRKKGVTGENFLRELELRLDNIVYRLGLAASRRAARQIITHKHIMVNDIRVNIPSYRVKADDVISVCEKSRGIDMVKECLEGRGKTIVLDWLETDPENFCGKVTAEPNRDQIPVEVNEQLIVEFYSR